MNEAIDKLLNMMLREHKSLQARIVVLNAAVCTLAARLGRDPQDMQQRLEKAYAVVHQKLLESIEEVSPSLAAEIDDRAKDELNDAF